MSGIFIKSRFKSRLFGLHVFFAFFRKQIFDKFTAAISCTYFFLRIPKIFRTQVFAGFAAFPFCI